MREKKKVVRMRSCFHAIHVRQSILSPSCPRLQEHLHRTTILILMRPTVELQLQYVSQQNQ